MSAPPSPAAKPLRTWRPRVLWTAGLLIALVLLVYLVMLAIEWWHYHQLAPFLPA